MKRLNIFFVGLIILLAGISCDTAKNPYHSPKSITKAFSESLYTGHFDEAKKYVQKEVTIPMQNEVESLNVAVSGSVIMFEIIK